MKTKDSEKVAVGLINPKVLDALGVKKQQVGKTIFRLPEADESFLRQLAKLSKKTIRDFLDSLAEIAEAADAVNQLKLSDQPPEGERMSYAISKEAKEAFSRLAREHRVSRDNIVRAALAYIAEKVLENALTPQQKIGYARIVADARDEMLKVYNSREFKEARDKLSGCGDPDWVEVDKLFAPIEQLEQLDVEAFIGRKQDEIDKARS